jgi:hypothetical protein
MANETQPFDASSLPDVSRLIHDVNRTGQPRLIQAGGEAARLSPARRPRRSAALTPLQREKLLRATFGGWKGLIDADQLKQDLQALQQDASLPRSL